MTLHPVPKPPPKGPKPRKPLKRTRPRKVRSRPRPGRVAKKDKAALYELVWERDKGICQACFQPCRRDDWDPAHVRNKRMWGDDASNIRVKHIRCHRIIEHCNGGVEKIVPSKKKEEAMATVHYVHIDNQDDMAGVARPGEPYPRPFVTLLDGRTMTYKEWTDAEQPA